LGFGFGWRQTLAAKANTLVDLVVILAVCNWLIYLLGGKVFHQTHPHTYW
jgi:hypothetical protein